MSKLRVLARKHILFDKNGFSFPFLGLLCHRGHRGVAVQRLINVMVVGSVPTAFIIFVLKSIYIKGLVLTD